ncbi:amidase [Geodermatophilus sabuli]|uniref:Aspartyl/glutamyl-tRNA(Asn/Gln) amidotransferase subunit A n=1 Tax=Geodermatophilus sabuli TaxID=1564158 RepID=A0A285EDH8_9ACTN|nr:amidase [Geodermatophilus sabuli]MBB3084637.1 aspartyl-tRNA(Asn)/glutamyl-tRNA(Gln) amidotransferase subunit A [Geodermatophilus sabuli]SNX97169.1 aspartyl/glutamyl-tRNA(Asn/Gln) amidotransferase subunit A [Geodermatophilus sabuli]
MKPYQLSITEASRLVASRELSPVELTRSVLERIDEVDGRLSAFVVVATEQAMEAAAIAEKEIADGSYRGPLHGIPIGIKDLFDVAGFPTSASSKVRVDHMATEDSACVQRLRDAGAIMVGKTHTHEFAYGVITPTTRNPWDLARIPGGSSGGSGAAVASGECLAAMGSDTGGSIRIPASVCGTVGLKPTYGRVSRHGVTSLCWALDHVGPLTRTVRDAALMLGVVAGFDPRDPATAEVAIPDYTDGIDAGVSGLTIGLPTNYFFDDVDPQVETFVREAVAVLAANGATVREVEIPYAQQMMAVEFGLIVPEASAYHQSMLRARGEHYQDDVRIFLEVGEVMLASQYLKVLRVRTLIKEAFREAFEGLDAIVCPTLPATAARVGQQEFEFPKGVRKSVINAYVGHSAPGNVTGLPALSLPCGFDSNGLPVGLQVIGRPYDERTVLRIGHTYEAATDWTARTPSL